MYGGRASAYGPGLLAAATWSYGAGAAQIPRRALTAWSAAGVCRPVLRFTILHIGQYQIDQGVAKADAYSVTMYIMAGLLVIGFNLQLA